MEAFDVVNTTQIFGTASADTASRTENAAYATRAAIGLALASVALSPTNAPNRAIEEKTAPKAATRNLEATGAVFRSTLGIVGGISSKR